MLKIDHLDTSVAIIWASTTSTQLFWLHRCTLVHKQKSKRNQTLWPLQAFWNLYRLWNHPWKWVIYITFCIIPVSLKDLQSISNVFFINNLIASFNHLQCFFTTLWSNCLVRCPALKSSTLIQFHEKDKLGISILIQKRFYIPEL